MERKWWHGIWSWRMGWICKKNKRIWIPADYDIKEEITHVDILDESGYKSFSKIVGKVKEIMYVKGIKTDEGNDNFWSLTISVFGCDFSALLPDNFDNSNLEMGAYISGIFSVVSF